MQTIATHLLNQLGAKWRKEERSKQAIATD